MACCILGAIILSTLFQMFGAIGRTLGLSGKRAPRPEPARWRLDPAGKGGTPAAPALRPLAARRGMALPIVAYVAAPIAVVAFGALLFRTDPMTNALVIRAGLSLGIPLSEFVAWCGGSFS
jgi:hypothetical protein